MTDKMPRGRSKEVSDEELFNAGRSCRGPSFTAGEVADALNHKIGAEACRKRLNQLVEKGLLDKKLRSGVNIYWIQTPSESPDSPAFEPA